MTKYLLLVAGPTAVGKTAVSIQLAQHFSTEIVSADSRQFYREMQIGTAVPTPTELAVVPHHFIQFRSIHQPVTAGQFEGLALNKLETLFQKHDIVVMTGGSGLFIEAVCKGIDPIPEVQASVRQTLNARFQKEGIESLQNELLQLDPTYHSQVDLNNPHRLIRALEVCIGTGSTYSSFRSAPKKPRPFEVIKMALELERPVLYARINQRVDEMMAAGLLEEVQQLTTFQELQALQTVGYQELFDFINGQESLPEAIEKIKRNTRRYAKRQTTWLRRDPEYFRASPAAVQDIFEYVNSCIQAK